MRTECPHDVSELERELELYLGNDGKTGRGDEGEENAGGDLESEVGGGSGVEEAQIIGKAKLERGDIIVSTVWESLVPSAVIRKLTDSAVSHSALYLGKGMVIEAIWPKVTARSLKEKLSGDSYAFVLRYSGNPQLGLTKDQGDKILRFALAQQGKPFDIGGGIVEGWLGWGAPGGEEKRFYCSRLVIDAYGAAGIDLAGRTPGDLARDVGKNLTNVGYLKMPGATENKELLLHEDDLNEEPVPEEEGSEDFDSQELDALEDPGVEERFAQELSEIADREFESDSELDEELDRGVDAVAEEYFVRRLRRKHRHQRDNGVFGKILKAGAKVAGKLASATPAGSLVKAGTSLVQGNVKGALKNLAKAAVGTALGPVAGTVATTAIDALGGEEGDVYNRRRRAMRRAARIARDAFREAADTLEEDFDHPLMAHEVAYQAVRRAMLRNGVRMPPKRPTLTHGVPASRPRRPIHRRVIRVRPDEEVLLVGGE